MEKMALIVAKKQNKNHRTRYLKSAGHPFALSFLTICSQRCVTPPFSLSPGGNGEAKTSSNFRRYPGRSCYYPNGTEGECLQGRDCIKERRDLVGYHNILRCSDDGNVDVRNEICCPLRLPGEKDTLDN